MAETLTIGGVDRSANLYRDSLRIEQAAGEFTAVCSFKLNDLDSSLAIQTRDAVTVTDNGTTLFAGEVVDIDNDLLSLALPGRRMSIRCQDYNILVEEAVIDGEEVYSAQADSAIIADLFGSYRADIDATTYVSTLQASMTITFQDVSLRQALSDICGRTGGRWYVDEAMALHYFTAETNVCAWYLSDTPDEVNSFPYQSLKERLSASTIVNRVLVVGKEVRDWYEDAVSVAAYGERPTVVTDNRITTQAGLDARGAALLDKWANPRVAYDVVTRKVGLRAGMDVRLICADWGLDETLTVRRLTIYWRGGHRFYALEIGEGVATALTTGRIWLERLGQTEIAITSIEDTVFDTDAPAAPNPLGAGNVTTGVDLDADGHQIVYAEITWSAVADTDLDHYELQLSTQSDFTSDVMSRNHPAGGNRHERFAGVLGNTTYYVRVRATDWVGNDSAWDYGVGAAYNFTSAADTTAPAQVAGLVAAASRTLIGVNWTANTEADLKHYEIQRADDVAGAPGAWATIDRARLNFYIDQDFSDAEIAAEDTFWYRVRAVDTSDNEGDWAAQTSAALSQIASDHLAALSVTTAKLAAGAVTAEKITVAELSAITADLGTITAGLVTGATIRTAAAGARVVLDSTDGLQCYNAAAALCAQIDVDGSGQIGASGGAVPPLTWNAAGQFNRIQANQLQIGASFFNSADGLLLLGPNCYLTATEWRSTRRQSATISGAFHQEQGRWLGTRALVVEEAVTNCITNPSFETGVAGWGTGGGMAVVQSGDYARFGDYSGKFTSDTGGLTNFDVTASTAADTEYTSSLWIKGNGTLRLRFYDDVANYQQGDIETLTDSWQRFQLTKTFGAGSTNRQVGFIAAADGMTVYVDGTQLEQRDFTTTYCDGSLGSGYAWTGTAHASTSTRTATEANLDALAGLISGYNTISVRLVAQAPHDSTVIWSTASHPILWSVIGPGGASDHLQIRYITGTGLTLYINGANRISVPVTFSQGDWLDIIATLDFATDEYKLYLDGELLGTDTTALTAPVIDEMNLGANSNADYTWDGPISELAIFDNVLTAAEVAQLYNLQRPLVDTGSMDTPGVYILDGKFRIASSTTGNRIEIMADEIAGYDSAGTKQFYLQASNGAAYAGAGTVWLDELGLNIAVDGGGAALIQFIKAGVQRGRIYSDTSGNIPQIHILAGEPPASNSSRLMLYAESPTNVTTGVRIASSGGEVATVTIRVDGSSFIIHDSDWAEYQIALGFSGLRPAADETGYVGSADQGWYAMYSKQFIDIGCLPFCDEGVELVDGRIVSDLEAIRQIKKAKKAELALCGMPKMDYATLPKIVYQPVYKGGELIRGNAELTALIGVIIGAIRELDGKVS